MPDQEHGHVVGDDLVDKGGVVDAPAGLWLAEHLLELALRRRVLPRLPDVRRRLGVDIVGELVLELLRERLQTQLLEGDLHLGLLGEAVGQVEGVVDLVGCLLGFLGGLFLALLGEGICPGGGPGQIVCIAERGSWGARVMRLEYEEQCQAGEREHDGLFEGEHGGRLAGAGTARRSAGMQRRARRGEDGVCCIHGSVVGGRCPGQTWLNAGT